MQETYLVNPEGQWHSGVLLSDICVDDMSEKQWLRARQHGPDGDRDYTIGGSDIGCVLGVSPYTSPLELWDKKKGIDTNVHAEIKQQEETSKGEIFERGHLYEEVLARQLEKDLRKEYGNENVFIGFDKFMYGCGETNEDGTLKYPYMIINYDLNVKIKIDGVWRIYVGEIKTLNSNDYNSQRNWKMGKVPPHYDAQCRYYMKGLNIDGAIILCAWGFDKEDRAHVFINRDKDLEDEMMDTADKFIQSLRDNIPPNPKDTERADALLSYMGRKYAVASKYLASSSKFEIPSSYKDEIEELLAIDNHLCSLTENIETINRRRDEILVSLFPLFEVSCNGNFELSSDKTVYIRRKDKFSRAMYDQEKFKQEEPALYQKYVTVKEEILLSKITKQEDKAIANKFLIEPKSKGLSEFEVTLYDKELGTVLQKNKTLFGYEMKEKKK